jgi:replicative DNA helicase
VKDVMEVLNPEEEERFLASLLVTYSARRLREDALVQVAADDFCNGNLGGLWAVAQKLQVNGKKIDQRSLLAHADSPEGSVKQLLWNLSQMVPNPGDYPQAVAEVQRCGKLRRLTEALQRSLQRALSAEEYEDAFGAAFEELNKLAKDDDSGESERYGPLLTHFEHAMKNPAELMVVPSPWDEVNRYLAGGFHAGRLYIIAARPGGGKSIAAHNAAEHAAMNDYPAIVFSVEMNKLEVTGRMVSNGASIEMGEIAERKLSDYSWNNFYAYADRARDIPLTINGRASLNLGYIKAECATQKRKSGLSLAVVDYLQLIEGEPGMSREQQIAGLSRGLKRMAEELGIAVVVPTQLNRKSVERDKPATSDLRESGAIEQDADLVLLLHRQFFTEGDMKGKPNGMVSLDIGKNRHGLDGVSLEFPFRGQYSRIG